MKKIICIGLTLMLLLISSCTNEQISPDPAPDPVSEVLPYPTYASSFDGLYPFPVTPCPVPHDNPNMGYMDRNGRIVINVFEEAYVSEFSCGLALITQLSFSDFEFHRYYINTKGQKMFGEDYLEANNFSEGKAVVKKQNGRYFVIDVFGNDLFEIVYKKDSGYVYRNMEYHEGRFWVGGQIVNETGQYITPEVEFTLRTDFNEGLAALRLIDGTLGYINRQGKIVLETSLMLPQSNFGEDDLEVYLFHGGLAYIGGGYINVKGERVIELPAEDSGNTRYNSRKIFSEGLAAISIGGKWGYINIEGEIIIEPTYTEALPFSEGLAAVSISDGPNNLFGFIDTYGNLVIDCLYESADSFGITTLSMKNGLIFVTYYTDIEQWETWWYGYIDRYGNRVLPHK